MNTARLRQARRLFNVPGVPAHTARHNARAWVRSVRHLGDKWVLTKIIAHVEPRPAPAPHLWLNILRAGRADWDAS